MMLVRNLVQGPSGQFPQTQGANVPEPLAQGPPRVSSQSIGVNAAFLQEIKDSHPDLVHVLHEVRTICHSDLPPGDVAKRLISKLNALRDCLAFQFALEETYGYIENVQSMPTSVTEMAARARSQHCSLYLEISSICEQAEDLQYRGFAAAHAGELIEATLAFDASLVRHERLEADLVELGYRAVQI